MAFSLVPVAYAISYVTPLNPLSDWRAGYCTGATSGPAADVATIRGIECVIARVLEPVPYLLALVAVGMIIMGGVRIILAGGDPKAMAAGWQQLTWAVIGLILLAGVWIALIFIQQFTGAPVTNFGIPQ